MSNPIFPDFVPPMKPLLTEKCPFVNPPNIKEKIQWVRPKLVSQVGYAESTADDQLGQTAFLGWRDDNKAKEVILETVTDRLRNCDQRLIPL
jgi:bifunctional non-homologous end joining protein LigD